MASGVDCALSFYFGRLSRETKSPNIIFARVLQFDFSGFADGYDAFLANNSSTSSN
jgi:hypothetical protein